MKIFAFVGECDNICEGWESEKQWEMEIYCCVHIWCKYGGYVLDCYACNSTQLNFIDCCQNAANANK